MLFPTSKIVISCGKKNYLPIADNKSLNSQQLFDRVPICLSQMRPELDELNI